MGPARPPSQGLYRVAFSRILRNSGRPSGDVRADLGRPRRHGWIRTGRVRPKTAPRGPGGIRKSFWEDGTFQNIFRNVPRTSRSRSWPNSARRNAAVTTRDPVVGLNGLKRTARIRKNLLTRLRITISSSSQATRRPPAYKYCSGGRRSPGSGPSSSRGGGSYRPGAAEWAYLQLEIVIRSLVRRISWFSDVRLELSRQSSGLLDLVKRLRISF